MCVFFFRGKEITNTDSIQVALDLLYSTSKEQEDGSLQGKKVNNTVKYVWAH